MSVKQQIITELNNLPDNKLHKIWQFIQLQNSISNSATANYIASESSLKKDWLKPEEDEAWKDL